MRTFIQAFATWIGRRQRFAEEWRFHLERAVVELIDAGFEPADAKRHAKWRLGRRSHYRTVALRELGGDLEGLLNLLPFARWQRQCWVAPLVAIAIVAVLFAVAPHPRAMATCFTYISPFTEAPALGHYIPLSPAGMAPMQFPGIVISTIGLVYVVRLLCIHRQSVRTALYGVGTFALLSIAGAAIWILAFQILFARRWTSDLAQGLVLSAICVLFPVGFRLLARWWERDLNRRCPVCLQRMGLELFRGTPDHLLISPSERELVCIEGHGTTIESRWNRKFQPDGGWSALGIR